MIYFKWQFFFHHAMKCLTAGYPENAVSWIKRGLGEYPCYDGQCITIDANSVKITEKGDIEFVTMEEKLKGTEGDGI